MKLVFSVCVFLFTLTSAQAGQYLGFEEIKEACLYPEKYQNQVAPKNLQIRCEEKSTKWVPAESSKIELHRKKKIISSLISDKYEVAPSVEYVPVKSQYASCPSFKEVLESVRFAKATSCDELLEFKGTEAEFCGMILKKAKEANPNMIKQQETGNKIDLCQQDDIGQEDPCDRGQRGRGRCR